MVVWGILRVISIFHTDSRLLLSWSLVPLSEIIGIDCTGLAHAFKLDGVNLTIAVKRKNLALTKNVMLNCLGAAGLWCRELFSHLLVEPADIAPAFSLQLIADSSDTLVILFSDFIKEAGRQLFNSLLRVCQQTGRNGIGIDINPEYIKMTQERLQEPFSGFDSIDERMRRIRCRFYPKATGISLLGLQRKRLRMS